MKLAKINQLTIFLFCITLVLSPLYVIRWRYFGLFPTTLLELLIWLTIISWVITKISTRNFRISLSKNLILPISIITIAFLISTIISDGRWPAIGILRAYFIEPLVMFVIARDLLVKTNNLSFEIYHLKLRLNELLLGSIGVAGLWLSILGILQFFFNWLIITPHQINRAHAVFNNGNALALFIGPIIVVLITRLLQKNKISKPIFIVLVVLLIAFIGTKSSGGMIALISTLIFSWISLKTRFNKVFQAVFMVTCVGFLIFLTQISALTPKVENPWERPGGTAQVRLCVWEGSFNLIKDNPVFGAGLRNFQKIYREKYQTCDAEPLIYPHNIILNFWTELGVLGLIGFGWLFWIIFRSDINIYAPFFIYFFIHGLVDVPYFKNDLALIFWVMLALWGNHQIQNLKNQIITNNKI